MTLTKKRLVLIAFSLVAVYFALLLPFSERIIGARGDPLLMNLQKILFLALAAAIVTGFILVLIFKRDFILSQWSSFNRYKYLLWLLVKRDFISRYRRSVLGVLWSLLNPLLTMLVLTLVFSYLFRYQIDNFPVYLLSGRIIFSFFEESTTQAMGSMINSQGIIRKVYVPKYVFPLSRVLSSLVNLLLSFLAFMLVFIITGAPFRWTMLLLPIPVIYTFVFSLGVAMLLSSLAVFFRDVTYLYGVLTMLLTFLTPIFYPVSIIPERFLPLYGLNPMYRYVDYFRCLAIWGKVPDLWANMVCIGFALSALCVGFFVFMRQQDRYILYL